MYEVVLSEVPAQLPQLYSCLIVSNLNDKVPFVSIDQETSLNSLANTLKMLIMSTIYMRNHLRLKVRGLVCNALMIKSCYLLTQGLSFVEFYTIC